MSNLYGGQYKPNWLVPRTIGGPGYVWPGASAAVVVGAAALVVGAGAPLLLMGGAAVLGGAMYGAFTGSANFNWTEAIVGSVIGGISAGVGSWIAGTGSAIASRIGVAAVDAVGGGIANVASYLIHEPNPTLGGALTSFGVGAGTAVAFMGIGAAASKGSQWAKGVLKVGGEGKINAKTSALGQALGGLSETLGPTAGTPQRPLHSLSDPMQDWLGPGQLSHLGEWNQRLTILQDAGVEVRVVTDGRMAYSPAKGGAGQLVLDESASISALRHEMQHFLDDQAAGYPGLGYWCRNPQQRWRLERRAYLMEIREARRQGFDEARRQLVKNAWQERKIIFEQFGTADIDSFKPHLPPLR